MQGTDVTQSDSKPQKPPETAQQHAKKYRLFLILLMSTIAFGSSFAYDLPQALQTQLQSPPLNLTFVQFDSLYSVYSTPNIFLPFFGGLLISFVGVNTSVLIFTFCTFAGQLLLTMGVSINDFTIMIMGRIVYAIGSEVLSIIQSIIAVKWFSSHDISTVLGWSLGICYLGSNLNIAFSPLIFALSKRLWVPCFLGTFLCFLSFSAGIGYVFLDRFLLKQVQANETAEVLKERQPKCGDFKKMSCLFWLISVFYFVFYLSVDGVTTTINDQIHKRFGFSNIISGNLVLIYYLQLIFVCPLVGKLADKYGKRAHFLVFAGLLCLCGQLLLGLLPSTTSEGFVVILPLFILGLADSIFETVAWSCLLLSLEPNMAAVGFGLAVSGMNLLNVVGMTAIGEIQDRTNEVEFGYYYSQLFLAGVTTFAILIALAIWISDKMGAKKLATPAPDEEGTSSPPESAGLLVNDENSQSRVHPY